MVHELSKFTKRRLLIKQDVGGTVDHTADHAQLVLAVVHVLDLIAGETWGETREAGKEQHQRLGEFGAPPRRQNEGDHRKAAVGMKIDAIEAAIGGPDLILAADIFLQHLLLDADCFAAEVRLEIIRAFSAWSA